MFAFFLYGGVPKSADRRTQTLDRTVANPEGFLHSMFQGFALGIEGLLGRWRDRDVSSLGENLPEFLQNIPSAEPALL